MFVFRTVSDGNTKGADVISHHAVSHILKVGVLVTDLASVGPLQQNELTELQMLLAYSQPA